MNKIKLRIGLQRDNINLGPEEKEKMCFKENFYDFKFVKTANRLQGRGNKQ